MKKPVMSDSTRREIKIFNFLHGQLGPHEIAITSVEERIFFGEAATRTTMPAIAMKFEYPSRMAHGDALQHIDKAIKAGRESCKAMAYGKPLLTLTPVK